MTQKIKLKPKRWIHLDAATQDRLCRIYAMHNLGNLDAESPYLKDAIAEIFQLQKI